MTESFFGNDAEAKPSNQIPELDDKSKDNSSAGGWSDRFQTEDGRMAAVMSYIPFLCFVPLLSMKGNPEARFHARQGVVIFLIEVVATIFLIDAISDFVFKAILVVAVIFSVAGIYFALQGKNYKLPVVGDWAEKTKL